MKYITLVDAGDGFNGFRTIFYNSLDILKEACKELMGDYYDMYEEYCAEIDAQENEEGIVKVLHKHTLYDSPNYVEYGIVECWTKSKE